MLGDYNYNTYNDTAEDLADRVINQLEVEGKFKLPIDPFYLMHRFNINYKFFDTDKLEGVYFVPDELDKGFVGINKNRPITRQRFTAAHEISHHIKDRHENLIYCPINGNDPIEKFANDFAAALLMPDRYIKKDINKYSMNGFVNFDSALRISLK